MTEADKIDLELAVNRTFPGLTMYARDVNLAPALEKKYKKGLILREKAFVDASSRFMGMVTTHRFIILSNHMVDLDKLAPDKHWGLHTAQRDSRFKVLGTVVRDGLTGIVLLHLPGEGLWKAFMDRESSLEQQMFEKAAERFAVKCRAETVPELAEAEWLDRCAFPVGMNDAGELWPLEMRAPWEPFGPGDCREPRYYRFGGGLLKHTPDEKYYTLDPFDESWHEAPQLAAELTHGEVIAYEQIRPEDIRPVVKTADRGPVISVGREEGSSVRFWALPSPEAPGEKK